MNTTAAAAAAVVTAASAYPIATWFDGGRWRLVDEPAPRRVNRPLLALILGALGGVVGGSLGRDPLAPAAVAALALVIAGGAMALVDLAVHRMPEPITLGTYATVAGILLAGAVASGQWGSLVRAFAGAATLWLVFFLYSLITGMGFADVQLIGIGGLVLGWIGWSAVVAGAAAVIIVPGAWATVALIAGRRGHFAAGPPILLGLLLAAAAAGGGAW